MPNQPKTPQSSFRIPVDLRDAAKAKATDRGESLTAVIIRALEEYVKT